MAVFMAAYGRLLTYFRVILPTASDRCKQLSNPASAAQHPVGDWCHDA
jgi:hypothetical protein